MNARVSLPLAALLMLTAGSLAFFVYYGQWFPPTLAVHFNGAGNPDGWMDRIKFIVIGSSLSFMVPTLIVAVGGVLPRMLPMAAINLPNKTYWMAPEHREAGFSRMLFASLWLGCLVQAFLMAIWILIARANAAASTPHLSADHAFVIGGFVVAVIAFVAWTFRIFARPR